MRLSHLLVGFGVLAAAGGLRAADLEPIKPSQPIRPIEGTSRLAEPAQAAPLEGSTKRFIKANPAQAPHLSPPAEQAGPIIAPITLKGHRDVPPSTTKPLKPTHARGTPPDGG